MKLKINCGGCVFIIAPSLLCLFGMFAFHFIEIMHLPTDTNEIVTVICVLGKCVSLP